MLACVWKDGDLCTRFLVDNLPIYECTEDNCATLKRMFDIRMRYSRLVQNYYKLVA